MRTGIIAFAAGVGWVQTLASLPAVPLLAAAFALAVVCLLFARGLLRLAAAGLLFGVCWASGAAQLALRKALPHALEGQDIALVVRVAGLPHASEGGMRFVADVVAGDAAARAVPRRIALSVYGALPAPVLPGQAWQVTVRLKRPHGNANPYGFDYEAWLLAQGIRATGYVRTGARAASLDARLATSPRYLAERARQALAERIARLLAGQPYQGVITALVIGEQRAIAQSDWDVFNRTGISHLVSISGLHITMVAALGVAGVSFLWRRLALSGVPLALLLPAPKAAALGGALVALVYVALAGFGVPAQRTLAMLSTVALALWCARMTPPSHVLCMALGAVLLCDPWAVLWPGLWLSFGAVATILYASQGRCERQGGWRAGLQTAARTQWAVTVGLAPLTLLLFGQVSLVSPIANALAIPVISLFVTPLALVGSILPDPVAGVVLGVAHQAVEWLAQALVRLAAPDWALWRAPKPSWWQVALALLGAAWLLAPRGWPLRWSGAAAFFPVLAQQASAPAPGQFTVTALDVGQGMALLVETHRHRLLYDAGPVYGPGANAGGRVILPYLRGRGIGHLDTLLLSHSDTDHVGGAAQVIGGMQVHEVLSSLPQQHALVAQARHHRRCRAGQRWHWDGVAFEILAPDQAAYGQRQRRANAVSCVLRVSNGKHAMLLAGDIEAAQEAQLVARVPGRLGADVLLAPHHGSGTSSTDAFLKAVAPSVAVFQVGHRNRYKHPKAAIDARYAQYGAVRLRTDHDGALTLRFGEQLAIDRYRVTAQRYWHGR